MLRKAINPGLNENKEIAKFIAASLISSIGAGMQFIGMTLLLYHMTNSAASIGWLLFVHSIAGILLSPWMGVFIDRWNFRYICVVSDGLRALALGLIPLFALSGDVPAWIIYATEFILAACDRFHWPASLGLIRSIVPKHRLLRVNSGLSIANQMGMLLGTAAGGVLIAKYSAMMVIQINIVTFFLSAGLTFTIATLYITKKIEVGPGSNMFKDWVEGFQYIKSRPQVIVLAIIQMLGYITLYVCNTLLPVFTERELKAGAIGFGYIEASWAAGAIAGSYILFAILKMFKNPHTYGRLSMILISVSLLAFLTSTQLIQAMAGYFLLGFFIVSNRIHNETLIQMEIETDFVGRVGSMIVLFISCISLGIYLGVGYLGDLISIRWVYLLLSVLLLLAAAAEMIYFQKKRFAKQKKERAFSSNVS